MTLIGMIILNTEAKLQFANKRENGRKNSSEMVKKTKQREQKAIIIKFCN